MAKYKVVITDYEYDDVDKEKRIFQNADIDFHEFQLNNMNENEIISAVKDADVIITQFTNITRYIIENLNQCKLIIKHGTGVDNVDCLAATEKGIYVSNVPDYGVDEVSNHSIALMMVLNRKLPQMTKTIRDGEWGYKRAVPIKRLEGSILGLVGLGRISKLIAKKLEYFNLRIIAYNPNMQPEIAKAIGVTLVDFDTLCRESDFISIHTPLKRETKHLFGSNEFKKMKNSAYIINTSRGSVISEVDLIQALKDGDIAGAGLDVFEREPLPLDSELLYMDNVIITPHSAWYSDEAKDSLEKKTAEEVINVLKGNIPYNLVNKEVLNKK